MEPLFSLYDFGVWTNSFRAGLTFRKASSMVMNVIGKNKTAFRDRNVKNLLGTDISNVSRYVRNKNSHHNLPGASIPLMGSKAIALIRNKIPSNMTRGGNRFEINLLMTFNLPKSTLLASLKNRPI